MDGKHFFILYAPMQRQSEQQPLRDGVSQVPLSQEGKGDVGRQSLYHGLPLSALAQWRQECEPSL